MADVSLLSKSKIFEPYIIGKGEVSFEEYFNHNLNPDNAPEGFLEELNRLIEIKNKRPLVFETRCTNNELVMIKVLKEYLSTVNPF